MKKYPRLRVYKVLGRCEHDKVDLPWRVVVLHHEGDWGFAEFNSASVESCWDHVAYKLDPKPPKYRLTKTLQKKGDQ